MESEQFYLKLAMGPNLVMQAPGRGARQVTLQTLDTTNPLQRWILQPQVAQGFSGVAIVNPETGMAVTYMPSPQGLVVQPYHPDTDVLDAWYVTPGTGKGDLQIAYVRDLNAQGNATLFWQGWGGGKVGGLIVAHTDVARGGNTSWNFKLANPTKRRGTDDDQASADVTAASSVGEPVGATA